MDQNELKEILKKHVAWLRGEEGIDDFNYLAFLTYERKIK